MGSVGLTLPWEHKLSSVARDGERRVESFRRGKRNPFGRAMNSPGRGLWRQLASAETCRATNISTSCRERV